jgi:hypothetical protein
MTMESSADILSALEIPEIPLNSFFLLKGDLCDLIGFVLPELGCRWVLMRDAELSARCKAYLERHGVRSFRSSHELADTARREQWPHWKEQFPIPLE